MLDFGIQEYIHLLLQIKPNYQNNPLNLNSEIIKNNQYTLYHQIKEANTFLSKLEKEMSLISSNAEKIADNSALTARTNAVIEMQTKVIAQNTKAIKWINLLT